MEHIGSSLRHAFQIFEGFKSKNVANLFVDNDDHDHDVHWG